jgi:ubiquinone/menaquinone biosynthesis C-methylase UbiE
MSHKRFIEGRKWCIPQASGDVAEIGFGVGANLPYYDSHKVSKLIAIEPNTELLDIADINTQLDIQIIKGCAEKMPLADASVDTIVSTWTLCSVENITNVAQEMHRVLKPGGKVIFVEHGRSQNTPLSIVQDIITPVWSPCAGGCRLNRSYFDNFEKIGFTCIHKEHTGTEYKGIAVKN